MKTRESGLGSASPARRQSPGSALPRARGSGCAAAERGERGSAGAAAAGGQRFSLFPGLALARLHSQNWSWDHIYLNFAVSLSFLTINSLSGIFPDVCSEEA